MREAWCAGRRAERQAQVQPLKRVTRHFAEMACPAFTMFKKSVTIGLHGSDGSKEILTLTGESMMCGQFPKKSGTTNEGNVQQSLAITQRTLANSSPHCSDFPLTIEVFENSVICAELCVQVVQLPKEVGCQKHRGRDPARLHLKNCQP